MKIFLAFLLIIFAAPFYGVASSSPELHSALLSWTLPTPEADYAYAADIVVTGSWQLPPGWVGNIYVYQDGFPIAAKTGEHYLPVSNKDGAATTSSMFTFVLGPQTDGTHQLTLRFWGGSACAINAQLSALSGVNKTPICVPTPENFFANHTFASRSYLVQKPPFARLSVTPTMNEPLDFGNVALGERRRMSFVVENTGGAPLLGSLSFPEEPFRCLSGCHYLLAPTDEPRKVEIEFTPKTGALASAVVQFSCKNLPEDAACFSPWEIRRVIGNTSAAASHGESSAVLLRDEEILHSSEETPIIASTLRSWTIAQKVNVGEERFGVLVLWNSGGGVLSGEVRGLPQDDFSCIENCTYTNLPPNTPWFVLVRFAPFRAGKHTTSLEFRNSDGSSVFVPLVGEGNSAPIPALTPRVLDAGEVPLGETRLIVTTLSNIGLGTLSGEVQLSSPRFSCVHNCHFRISPADSIPVVFAFTPSISGLVQTEANIGLLSIPFRGRGISPN